MIRKSGYRFSEKIMLKQKIEPQFFDSITSALEYWIIRWSLSSGGAQRRPGGG